MAVRLSGGAAGLPLQETSCPLLRCRCLRGVSGGSCSPTRMHSSSCRSRARCHSRTASCRAGLASATCRRAARATVGAIVLAGAALLSLRLPLLTIAHPPLLASMLVAAIAASSLRVALPGAGASAPVSATMAALFASLLLIGPGRDADCRGGCRLHAVHVRHDAAESGLLDSVQHVSARDGRVRGRPCVHAITGGVALADASSFDSLELPIIVSALVWVFRRARDGRRSARHVGLACHDGSARRAVVDHAERLRGTGAGAVAAVLVHGTTWRPWPAALLPLVLTHVARRLSVERIEAEQRRT